MCSFRRGRHTLRRGHVRSNEQDVHKLETLLVGQVQLAMINGDPSVAGEGVRAGTQIHRRPPADVDSRRWSPPSLSVSRAELVALRSTRTNRPGNCLEHIRLKAAGL